jgi:hypothetical protein
MTKTVTVPAVWTVEERQRLVDLLEQVDSVELKMSVPDADRRSAVAALDLDPLRADMMQVWFFDTPDLDLNASGVIARARRTKRRDDVIIKLRPVVPDELAPELRAGSGFGVEIDAMPGGFVCSARLKADLRAGKVKEVTSGKRPQGSLFNKQQRAFFTQSLPDGVDVDIDALSVLGPITVLKLKFSPQGYDRKMVAELWFYPDGSRILELSTKCAPAEAFDVVARTRVFLEGRGIDLTGLQQTKTRTALEYFSQERTSGA